jgi:hypothetical protein
LGSKIIWILGYGESPCISIQGLFFLFTKKFFMGNTFIQSIRSRMLTTVKIMSALYIIYLISVPALIRMGFKEYGTFTLFLTIYMSCFIILYFFFDSLLEKEMTIKKYFGEDPKSERT